MTVQTRYRHRWHQLTDEPTEAVTSAMAVPSGVLIRTVWSPYGDNPHVALALIPGARLLAGPVIEEHIEAEPEEGDEARDIQYREIRMVDGELAAKLLDEKWTDLGPRMG